MQKKTIIISALVAIIIFAAGVGIYAAVRNNSTPQQTTEAVTESETETTTPAIKERGAMEIILDGLYVKANTLTLPAMQLSPLLNEWDNITWESDDTTIAEVSEDGLILALAPGECTLTGKSDDGMLTAYLPVTVEADELSEDALENTQSDNAEDSTDTSDELSDDSENTAVSTSAPTNLLYEIKSLKVSDELMDAFWALYEADPDEAAAESTQAAESGEDLEETTENVTTETVTTETGGAQSMNVDMPTLAELALELTWESDLPNSVSVDERGVLSFNESGIVTIKAYDKNDKLWLTMELEVSYGVEIPLTNIEAETDSLQVAVNETITPVIYYTPEDATNKNMIYTSSDESIATVNNYGEITGVAEGNCTITAVSVQDPNLTLEWKLEVIYVSLEGIAAANSSLSVAVNDTVQAPVTFTPANASEKDLTWQSSNTAIATVDENGNVTGVGVGECTVTATAVVNAGFTATFKVNVTNSTTINTSGVQIVVYIGSQTVVVYKDGVQIKSMICSTGRAGHDTPTGTYKVQGKVGPWYKFRSVGCWVKYGVIIKGDYLFHSVPYYPPSDSSDIKNAYMSIDNYNNLGRKASSGCVRMTAADIEWLYRNCSVGTAILITNDSGPGPDSYPAALTLATGDYGWDPSDSDPRNPYHSNVVSSLELSESQITMTDQESRTLSASVSPSTASYNLTWSSSDSNVASVSDGVVTGHNAGSATIYCTETYTNLQVSCQVTITASYVSVEGIQANLSGNITMYIGETKEMGASITPSNANNKGVNYQSSDASVASVSGSGQITAQKKVGTCTITAYASENGGITASVTITVKGVDSISITNASNIINLKIGESFTLNMAANPSSVPVSYTYSINNSNVAVINNSGLITAISTGTATVTITDSYSGKSKSINIEVTEPETAAPSEETTSEASTN